MSCLRRSSMLSKLEHTVCIVYSVWCIATLKSVGSPRFARNSPDASFTTSRVVWSSSSLWPRFNLADVNLHMHETLFTHHHSSQD